MGHDKSDGNQHEKSRSRTGRILEWKSDVPLFEIPNENFASVMLKIFSQHGETTALVDAETQKSYTYGDLRSNILRMQGGLLASGLTKGDAVILMSTNHIDIPVVMFSVYLSNAVCVPINPSITAEELVHVLRVSGAKWAVAHRDVIKIVERASELMSSPPLRQVWMLGDEGITTRPTIKELMKGRFFEHRKVNNNFDAATTVALMPFSSGTTGLPKGVMLSHKNLSTTIIRAKYLGNLSKKPLTGLYNNTLLLLPMYHIYGYNMMIATLLAGGRVIVLDRFSPIKYLETIQKYKVTFSPIVPHLVKFLVETPLLEKYDLSSLKGFVAGSSPISEATLQSLMKKSGKLARQGFGMTESSGIGCSNGGTTGYKPNSIGKLSPYFEGKVIDIKTGTLLKEREEGELCLRGPAIMMGYANNARATAETIDSEGWLHTGDICYYDEDNFLYITDRMKDLIKVKSHQVSPAELENIIQQMEGVSEVAVAGVPNERLGEAPRAWVVLKPGAVINKEFLMKYVADKVAPYKQLAGGVEVVKSIPKNHIGKVSRRHLKKSYAVNSRSKL